MKRKRSSFLPGLIPMLAVTSQLFFACVGQEGNRMTADNPPAPGGIPASTVIPAGIPEQNQAVSREEIEKIYDLLDEFAELERSGVYRQGMGLAESALREKAGDMGGSVIAAFKEMSWAYSVGILERKEIEQGIQRVIDLEGQAGKQTAVLTALAVQDFINGHWDLAAHKLSVLFRELDEPDSFVQWMLLTCALEKDPSDRKAGSAYRAMRARYVQFPEYWYRGAKFFSKTVASEYAEFCINLAPFGPFAAECRSILATFSGLKEEDGLSIKSKKEIESLNSRAVTMGNPALLEPLISLIGLPENPFTVYAIGALKSLTALPGFRDYLDSLAVHSKGRLADRLTYICRG